MKPKKRYTTEQQITQKIDLFTKRKETKETQISALLTEARIIRESSQKVGGNEALLKEARAKEKKVDSIGKRVVVLDRKLSNLREKLGQFRTQPIPGFLPDNSVEGA